jgi:hypothetical protein
VLREPCRFSHSLQEPINRGIFFVSTQDKDFLLAIIFDKMVQQLNL